MPDFQRLAENVKDDTLKEIYTIIANRQPQTDAGVFDSAKEILCTPDEVTEIQALMLSQIQANMTLDGGYQSLEEARKSVANGAAMMVADAFFNPVNRIGTPNDPGYWNQASIPVSISPMEATSYYASGGVPARIIDAKSQGILVNGYQFEGGLNPADLDRLKDYSDGLGFDRVLTESVRDGLIFGGDLMVPHFRLDTNISYEYSFDELVKRRILVKDSIERFWHADRWNCVLVPDYDISANDYLSPKSMFVPITGKTVNTSRAAIVLPKMLPYWGTLRQMGWGISDMEGWIRALLGYEMCVTSIPIMAQQMSVMYRHIPLDGIIAQNGPEFAQQFANKMSQQMVEMSNVAPKTFNMIGEIKTIDRHYQGFQDLVMLLRQDIGAKSGIPESVLFHSSPTGFSDNEADTTLKQAEVIQSLGNKIIPQLSNLVKVLVYSCFGPDSPQAKVADQVRLSFDSPVVLTNEERNAAGTMFSGLLTSFIGAGLQPADAIEMAHSFTPDIELPQDVMDRLNAEPELGETDEGGGIESLGAKLRGETPVNEMGKRLRGETPVNELGDKLRGETDKPSLLSRITNPVKRLFSGIRQ